MLDLRVLAQDRPALWTRWTFSLQQGRLQGTVQDVSESHGLLDQLLQSQKLESMGTLAGAVAHDVNNLLAVMVAQLDFIQLEGLSTPALDRRIRTLDQAIQQAKNLANQLMSFARRQEPRRVEVDLNALILEARDLFQAALGKSVRLALDLAPGLPRLSLDPGQIHQLLMNLALNARDAMPAGGELTLRTRGSPELREVALEVEDTGEGIPERIRSRIFEPFFTTKPEGKGTGLGLAVAYGIVTGHGGSIRCLSTPGTGTTFLIRFMAEPQVADGEARAPAAQV
jgi:signal transduction histidine kinase